MILFRFLERKYRDKKDRENKDRILRKKRDKIIKILAPLVCLTSIGARTEGHAMRER